MFIRLLLTLSVLAAAFSKSLSTLKMAPFHGVLDSKFASLRVAGKMSPAGYVEITKFANSTTCQGHVQGAYGIGTEICMVGLASDGTAMGSVIYSVAQGAGTLTVTKKHFSSEDCSGLESSTDNAVPLGCQQMDDGSILNFAYTTDKNAWYKYGAGVTNLLFDTAEHCAAGGNGGLYTFASLGNCITNDDGTSSEISSCSGDKVTIEAYSDGSCSSLQSQVTAVLPKCSANNGNDDDYSVANFQTFVCV